jgi:integrase
MRAGQQYQPKPGAAEQIHETDCVRGLPLAGSTVRQIHFILRAAFGLVVRWGWLPSNPAAVARPPRLVQQDVEPPTPEQVANLINGVWSTDPDFGTLIWLGMMTGARRGELCALRWTHFDPQRRELRIARNYVQRGKQRKEKDTKTHQSRYIALDEVTVSLLEEHRLRCRERALICGSTLRPGSFLFSLQLDGSAPLLPDSVTQRFRRLANRYGVPAQIKGLRHYSATQLLAAGVDLRTVAGRLGHGGGGATTLRVYSHWVVAADRRASEVLGKAMRRPGEGQE